MSSDRNRMHSGGARRRLPELGAPADRLPAPPWRRAARRLAHALLLAHHLQARAARVCEAPPRWCHRRLPRPPGRHGIGSGLLYAFRRSSCAAQIPAIRTWSCRPPVPRSRIPRPHRALCRVLTPTAQVRDGELPEAMEVLEEMKAEGEVRAHCMGTACASHAHRMRTARAPHAHRTRTARAPHAHRTRTACAPHARCKRAASALHARCMRTAGALARGVRDADARLHDRDAEGGSRRRERPPHA